MKAKQTAFSKLLVIAICLALPWLAEAQTTSITGLKLLGKYIVPHNLDYKGTTVGGLSGIDYDAEKNCYYLISDDRSIINPARFYTAKINISPKGIDNVLFVNVTLLTQKNGEYYPSTKDDPAHSPDPEALRYNPLYHNMVWSSEGERAVKINKMILEDPAITIADTKGHFIDSFPLPPQLHMHVEEKGPRQNTVFEGVAFGDNYKTLYVSVEEPLYEDGPRTGVDDAATWTRILKYDIATKKPLAQYAYHLEPVAHKPLFPGAFAINGISDILYAGNNNLLVMERSFSTGRMACTIRIYATDVSKAIYCLTWITWGYMLTTWKA
jgi:hypothetical protein